MKKLALCIIGLLIIVSPVFAQGESEEYQAFPSKPITLVVPWSAGGGTDTLARSLAKYGQEHFDVPVVVENTEGAMGAIGAQRVKQGKPEGYELLVMSGFVSWIGMVQDYPVGAKDFTPVMNLNRDPAAIAVSKDSPINNLDELKEYCLKHPGEFTVSHSGDGTTWHMAGLSLANTLGVDMNFVPFNGTAPGIAAVMGKKIDAVAGGAAEFVSQALGGEIKVLAVLSEDTFAPLPEVATAHEMGYDIEFYTTRGLVAPLGLDPERAQTLAEGFSSIMKEPEFIETMGNIGLGIHAIMPKDYEMFLDDLIVEATASLKKVGML